MRKNLLLASALEKYPSPFFVIQPIINDDHCGDFTYVYANPAFCIFVGKSNQELIGHTFSEVFGEDGEAFWLDLFYDTVTKRLVQYVESITTVLKRHLTVETFYIENDMCGCVIRDYKSAEEDHDASYDASLQKKAYTDALTGLYNRFHLQEKERFFEKKDGIGLAFFDLNNLKYTNDMYGHGAGDKLLCEFAQMLTAYFGNSLVYRLGGDEFLVISCDVPEKDFIDRCTALKQTLDANGKAAMGFKFCSCTSKIWDDINECDRLMYQHKTEMKKGR